MIFFREINTFNQQGCIKLIKSERFLFKINAGLLNILFIKESWKCFFSQKFEVAQTIFNINYKKCLLDYLNDFWRIIWHW